MSNADIDIEALYVSDLPEPAALKRIRRLALPFEIGFAALTGLAVLLFILILVLAYVPGGYVTFNAAGGWLTFDPSTAPFDAVTVPSLPIMTQLAGLIVGSLVYGALITALWSLHRLFACYRQGDVFTEAPMRLMRRAGLAMILFAAAPGLMQPVMRLLGSPDRNWFHSETLPVLLIGSSLFLFAHIQALGMELQRENKGFI